MNVPMSASQQQPARVRVVRDPLVTITCLAVLLAVAGYAYETVRQNIAAGAAVATRGAQAGRLEEHSYSNSSAAHVTLTNLNAFDAESCFKGVVTAKVGGDKVESAPVCTGLMKPRTTVTLEAPYAVGAVERACASDADRFGNQHLDWSKCSFTTEPVNGPTAGR